ncbi:hypothetical protein DUNSADRAFT_7674 [Dunaliella salina]|uniref:Encoded protein n=1 Tax=Dunaliella salina TaxID=3046 RepID=A0ABQ7H668_DUNSA|nr:hypothetical protein DUNSADRAFT_7674 [Dunaliella salina]|eukprot:KAF5842360.1 hypothetical protein DUNSADRAFT_7674 [Dunaliella salina]
MIKVIHVTCLPPGTFDLSHGPIRQFVVHAHHSTDGRGWKNSTRMHRNIYTIITTKFPPVPFHPEPLDIKRGSKTIKPDVSITEDVVVRNYPCEFKALLPVEHISDVHIRAG